MNFQNFYDQQKQQWLEQHSYRSLKPRSGIDFCSNDYLGFTEDKPLQKIIYNHLEFNNLGSGGSRLLRGNSKHIEDLESRLAAFSGQEAALMFPSGYQANIGLFSSLLKTNAIVFSDERVHASIIDGIRLAGCQKYIWQHNDIKDLEMLLRQKADRDKLNIVVVESLYSMSGSKAPLREISDLCQKYGCYMIVDEAHATGVFGMSGAGLVDELGLNQHVLAKIHTAGKSLGVSGAWVASDRELIDLIVNTSRSFIYSTAPAHYQVTALACAVDYLVDEYDQLKEKFVKKVSFFQEKLQKMVEDTHFQISGQGGPVTALLCGDNECAVTMMNQLETLGFDIRAIRPPSVPPGEALLRITIPLQRTEGEITALLEAIESLIKGRP